MIEYFLGLNGLASQFHEDWGYSGGVREVVGQYLGPRPPASRVDALRHDVILVAGLPVREVEILWQASVGSCFEFGPDGVSPSGSALLAMILEECDRRASGPPAPRTGAPEPVDAVLAAIAVISPLFEGSKRLAATAAELHTALQRCARERSAELALRLLLRITLASFITITPQQYAGLQRLGEELDYDEFLVGDLEFLVE